LQDTVIAARPDILVTNELPFGEWLAEGAVFSEEAAHLSLRGLRGLIDLNLPAVISSRPVWSGKRLANEGSCLKTESSVRCTESSIFPTSLDGMRANGIPATTQVLPWPRCWG
jgi:N-carbamoylputrescine amidase